MAITRPYRRTHRQFVDGIYRDGYALHPKFAQSPEHYVRAFLIILKDLQELFDYVEPSDKNLSCYSYRIHSLLLRVCVEIEANCKAILKENGYSKSGDWSMREYKKIEQTHLLSSYKIKVPNWTGDKVIRAPFSAWTTDNRLPWYSAYNITKHDRHSAFDEATFDHLIDAVCGLLVVLTAQFGREDFSPGDNLVAWTGPNDGMETGIGEYFRVRFPDNWPPDLQYNFHWPTLKDEEDPFQNFDYSQIT